MERLIMDVGRARPDMRGVDAAGAQVAAKTPVVLPLLFLAAIEALPAVWRFRRVF